MWVPMSDAYLTVIAPGTLVASMLFSSPDSQSSSVSNSNEKELADATVSSISSCRSGELA